MSLHHMESKKLIVISAIRGITAHWERTVRRVGANLEEAINRSFRDSIMSLQAKCVLGR